MSSEAAACSYVADVDWGYEVKVGRIVLDKVALGHRLGEDAIALLKINYSRRQVLSC